MLASLKRKPSKAKSLKDFTSSSRSLGKEAVEDLPPSQGPELENAIKMKSWTLAKKCIAQNIGTEAPGVFHLAIRHGAPDDLIQLLLEIHVGVINEPQESHEGKWFPLLLAVRFAPHAVGTLLRIDGVNVNCTLSTGENAVMLACKEGLPIGLISTLIKAGVDVNTPRNDGITALMICTLRDEVEVMDFLLKCGAKPDLVNVAEGTTALYLVTSKTLSYKAMEALILAQANVDIARLTGETPLLALIEAANSTVLENVIAMLTLLIQAGADVNLPNLSGETPLCVAAEKNVNPHIVSLLLRAGADIHRSSSTGMTPILLAVVKGSSRQLVELLLANGASIIDTKFQRQTPVQIAKERGFTHLLDLLEGTAVKPAPVAAIVNEEPFKALRFCAQCRNTQQALVPCNRGCGVLAYCSNTECESKHHASHSKMCQLARERKI